MLIADYPITKQYWEPQFNWIVERFEKDKYTIVAPHIYKMQWRNSCVYVAGKEYDGTLHIIGWYSMRRPKGWEAYEVYQAFIFKDHRCQGWGNKMLSAMINVDNMIVASGSQQTKEARRFWRCLVLNEKYIIWAHDFKNLDSCAPVYYDPENDALDCALPIYDDYTGRKHQRDVRLIAIRKPNESIRRPSLHAKRHQVHR